MGFFTRSAPATTQSAISSLVDIISLSDNGMLSDFTGELALSQSDIFTAVKIIASDVASADYSAKDNDLITNLLSNNANDSTTSYNFLFSLIANTLLTGNGYALIERNSSGMITGLRNIKSSKVTVLESDDEKELFYRVSNDTTTLEYDSSEIIHIKTFSVDGKVGISPIYSLKSELNMLKNGNTLLANFFKKGANVGGILKIDKANLNNESKTILRESFEEVNSGANNAGTVMVMGAGESFEQLAIDTKVLDMIQNNKYSTQQIAKAFAIPLSRFGQELVNTSDSDANDIYITSTLNAYKRLLVQELSKKLSVDMKINFLTLQGRDRETMFHSLIKDKQGEGVLTVNEVRHFYGLPAVTGGASIYKNSASQTLENLEKGGN